jgi:hypothetical protein
MTSNKICIYLFVVVVALLLNTGAGCHETVPSEKDNQQIDVNETAISGAGSYVLKPEELKKKIQESSDGSPQASFAVYEHHSFGNNDHDAAYPFLVRSAALDHVPAKVKLGQLLIRRGINDDNDTDVNRGVGFLRSAEAAGSSRAAHLIDKFETDPDFFLR